MHRRTESRGARRGFTLVELLVAMGVLAILAGMVTAALVSVNGQARKARCEAELTAMNAILQSRFEEFLTLRINNGAEVDRVPPGSDDWVTLGQEASRVRLINLRDQLRYELPDRKSDLMFPPQTSAGVPALGPTTQIRIRNFDAVGAGTGIGRVTYRRPVPPVLQSYRQAIANLTGTTLGPNWADNWTEQYESSECLYLILASTTVAGRNGLDSVRQSQIRDTDGDGVPEILDPWGTPIAWMRWPVGYWLTYAERANWPALTDSDRLTQILQRKQELGRDQYDLLRVDWRNVDGQTSSAAPTDPVQVNDTFNVPPVIVSAGPDGEFDLMLRSSDSTTLDWQYGEPIRYWSMTWPVTAPLTNPYYYPDPFPRTYHGMADPAYNVDYLSDPNPFAQGNTGGWVGAYYDADGDLTDDSVDNIYSVRAR